MTIYLACTVRGDRGGVAAGRAIASSLVAHGHRVLTLHLLADDVDAAESTLTSRAIYARDMAWLESCDVLVAEASGSSYGVGFEIGYLLGRSAETGQRAVLVWDRHRESAVSRLITGNSHPACTPFAYDSMAELMAFVDRQFGPRRRPNPTPARKRRLPPNRRAKH